MSDADVIAGLRAIIAEAVARELDRRGVRPANDDAHITAAEYARRYSISLTTVRDAIREGRLPAQRIGRAVRIPASARIETRRAQRGARMKLLRGGRP